MSSALVMLPPACFHLRAASETQVAVAGDGSWRYTRVMTTSRAIQFFAAAVFFATDAALAQSSSVQWLVDGPATPPAQVSRDTTVRRSGRSSVRVHFANAPAGFTSLAAVIPATSYRGDSLRFSVYLRSSNLQGGGGVVWMRADGSTPNLAFATTQNTPLLGTSDWTPVSISFLVPAAATQIVIGIFSMGAGTMWVDDAAVTGKPGTITSGFEEGDPIATQTARPTPAPTYATPYRAPSKESPLEPPRALSEQGLVNIIAFTRAMGYVRFFHPSDEALTVNWNEFAAGGIRAVERAGNPRELAAALEAQFRSIAPSVVFEAGSGQKSLPTQRGSYVQFWMHSGVGSPSGGPVPNARASIYVSRRIVVPASEMGKPYQSGPLVPDRPLSVSLGGAVAMTMPIAISTDRPTLPDSLSVARPAWPEEDLSVADRATRLADVALAWSVFQQFYPYFDVVKTDWMATLRRSLTAAATDDETSFAGTLRRLVADLHDGHGGVYPAANFVAPDVRLDWIEGSVVVTAVGPGTTGVNRGDVVTTIDGRAAAELLQERSQFVSGATPQWIRNVALPNLLSGARGTSIALGLRGASGSRTVTLTRDATTNPRAERPAKIAEVSPGVMYVDLDRITDQDFNEALPRLITAKGIIFDMRGYPRQVNTVSILAHLSDTTIASAHFEVPMTTMPDRAGVVYRDGAWRVPPIAPKLTARIAFLSGGGAISYAESTLGVVEAFKLGEIVGEASAGTNGNVNSIVLPGPYSIAWTGMRVTKRDGTPHHGVGVKPTVPVSPTIAGIRQGRDEVLERAIAVVGGRIVP